MSASHQSAGRRPPASCWRVAAASAVGTAHLDGGGGCQDAFEWRTASGNLLLAVADGAGSAPRGADGAREAVRAGVDALEGQPLWWGAPGPLAQGVAAMAQAFLEARSAALLRAGNRPLRDLASTLTLVVATPERLVVGQIGDGLVVAREAGGGLFAASRPQKGQHANESAFLSDADALQRLEVRTWTRPFDGLVAITDGLLRLACELPGYRPHARFYEPLLAYAAAGGEHGSGGAVTGLREFLVSPRVRARTDDDLTLVVAVRTGGAGGVAPAASGP